MAGPVVEPPVTVLVEHVAGLGKEQLTKLSLELQTAIHHHLRFRPSIVMQVKGEFELKTGATGKSKLVEVDPDFFTARQGRR